MIDHHSLAADPFVRNPFSSAAAAERALNAAILQADISSSFEEYLEIFDAFYSDEIEVSSDTGEGPGALNSSRLSHPASCIGRSGRPVDIPSRDPDSWRRCG